MNDKKVAYCTYCGAKLGDDERICTSCGQENRLGGVTQEDLFPPAPDVPPKTYERENPYGYTPPSRSYEPRQSNTDGRMVGRIIGCILCVLLNIIWVFI